MNAVFSRRNWLKAAGMLAAGATLSPMMTAWGAHTPVRIQADGLRLWKEFTLFPENNTVLRAKLNANENPFGPSEVVQQAIQRTIKLGNRYAFPEMGALREALARKEGVKPEQILLGAGSTDLLEKVAVWLFKQEGEVVSANPGYMSLIGTSIAMGAKWIPIRLKEDYAHDLDAMQAAVNSNTRLVYICNPNNPTGSVTDSKLLLKFCLTVSEKVPVFVDEAYLDYLPAEQQVSMVEATRAGKNVIVARTFSKINGMAGLRVGYIVAPVPLIEAIKGAWMVDIALNPLSVHGALAALSDEAFREMTRRQAAEAREFTYGVLKSLGITWIPSNTSFVLFPLPGGGQKFSSAMADQGVAIRIFTIWEKEWCRVSMGTTDEMKLFADALRKVWA